jgi:hypothetical protein
MPDCLAAGEDLGLGAGSRACLNTQLGADGTGGQGAAEQEIEQTVRG